jgi:hypothetical protein
MMLGSLVSIIVVLVVIGLCLYLLETYVPMSPPIKTVIRVVVVLFLVLWLLQALGLWAPGPVVFPRR